jgi:hypothetical protein
VQADFASAPEDSALARTVTEALRIDLSQSRAVTLAEPGQVRQILGQMTLPRGVPLDLETARELPDVAPAMTAILTIIDDALAHRHPDMPRPGVAEIDAMLAKLDMPFFRTPGNHDIANSTAQQVWRDRHGATHYSFVYKDVLFVVLDSEDPPRAAPEGMEEKIETYNRLQTEDPEKAQAMLAEFMSDEAVVAALGKPVEFGADQVASVEKTLAQHDDVRWTFVFLHEPAWENPSESFKVIQALLKDRPHTFFGGHLHYYDYDQIDGHEHITMGPAGASFHHEGPGNVDHVMWVSVTGAGPKMANIALKGVFDRKGLDPELFGAYDRKGAES